MLLEVILPCTAYLALGLMRPTDRQRERDRQGLAGHPLREQVAALQQVGLVRSR